MRNGSCGLSLVVRYVLADESVAKIKMLARSEENRVDSFKRGAEESNSEYTACDMAL